MTSGEPASRDNKGAEATLVFSVRIAAIITISLTVLVIGLGIARDLAIYIFDLADVIGSDLRRFGLGVEASIGTWYSVVLLYTIAAELAAIAWATRQLSAPHAGRWLFLCIVFVLLSLDESAGFHEGVVPVMRDHFEFTGLLFFPWVIPGLIFVAFVFVATFPLLLSLPRRYLALFVAAGCIYLGGAVGFEMIGGFIAERQGFESVAYGTAQIFEESLEIIGLNLFFIVLLEYLFHRYPSWKMTRRQRAS
jgi:hypothetical protein